MTDPKNIAIEITQNKVRKKDRKGKKFNRAPITRGKRFNYFT